jgi:hypothetical protein
MSLNKQPSFEVNENDYRLTDEEYQIYLRSYNKNGNLKLPNIRHDKERRLGEAMQNELGDEFLDSTIEDRDAILNLIIGGQTFVNVD